MLERKRCSRCLISSSQHKKDYHPSMNLMYIRIHHTYSAVGWFCKNCGKMQRLRKKDIKNVGTAELI